MSLVALPRLSAVTAPRISANAYRSAATIGCCALALAVCVAWRSAVAPSEGPLWISLAILAASLASSVAGFAFSAICGAMLFHLIDDPVRAVQIMMVCSVGGQSLMVWSLRREIPWRALSVFLAGAALGLPLGIFILLNTRPTLYVQIIGVALVLYAVFMLLRRPLILRRQNVLFDAMVGFLGGVTGGAAALPGMFVTIWCGFKGWPKEHQRGVYQPFILIVQLAAIVLMALPDFAPKGRRPTSGIAYQSHAARLHLGMAR